MPLIPKLRPRLKSAGKVQEAGKLFNSKVVTFMLPDVAPPSV